MSSILMTDCTMWVGGQALATYSNELSVKTMVEAKETTTFGSGGAKTYIGGLRDTSAELKGFWESAVDTAGVANLGTVNQVCTASLTGTAGDACVFYRAGAFSYDRGGAVGDVNPFTLSMSGSDGVGSVHGQVAAAQGNVSATGALGSGLNLGAVGASQYLYASFHVFTAGSSITVKIESDDNANFTSATDRITFSAITTTGGTWATRLAGAVADTYYRFNVTAITGTFNVGAAIGIGS